MNRFRVVFLSCLLFSLPGMLYLASEPLMAQIILVSQMLVLWGLLPFFFRGEEFAPKEWSRRSLIFSFIVSLAIILPFLLHLSEKSDLVTTDIMKSSVRLFSETSELFLILGVCLASFFVVAALIKRRGSEA